MSSSNGTANCLPLTATPELDVIYENAEMLVVNKPADVPMDGDLATRPCTVESMVYAHMRERGIYDDVHERLQQEGKRKKQLKFVHQLDYSTSGVLCLAFTKDMAARLAHCFEMRTTRKYYVALLHGHIPEDASSEQAPAAAVGTEKQATPFKEWVAECHNAWHGLGSVRADACAAFPATDNARALNEFRHLLRDRSPGCRAGNVEGTAGASLTPVVHRYRARLPPAVALPDSTATVQKDTVYTLLTTAPVLTFPTCCTIDLPVGYDATDAAHFRMAVTAEQSRPASTSLLVLRRTYLTSVSPSHPGRAPRPVTLVLLSPHTGRRHQLRVHCRAIGYPIVGDNAYAVDLAWCRPLPSSQTPFHWSQIDAPRMYLHAWRLLLPGAVTGHVSEKERVEMKKKRRRETLGLSERGGAAVSADKDEWTEFVAPMHFLGVTMEFENEGEEG
ncbi:RNA pseudouridylate synthase [Lotmaria passim]